MKVVSNSSQVNDCLLVPGCFKWMIKKMVCWEVNFLKYLLIFPKCLFYFPGDFAITNVKHSLFFKSQLYIFNIFPEVDFHIKGFWDQLIQLIHFREFFFPFDADFLPAEDKFVKVFQFFLEKWILLKNFEEIIKECFQTL